MEFLKDIYLAPFYSSFLLSNFLFFDFSEGENVPSRNPLQMQTAWEEKHKGNFRKIYPGPGSEKYDKFFNQNLSSLFQDTAASRAREEASRVQREESLVNTNLY